MRLKWIRGIASSLTLLAMTSGMAFADECAYRDGGYCVPVIMTTTSGDVIQWIAIDKRMVREEFDKCKDQVNGPSLLNCYDSLWNVMVKYGKATQKERDGAFEEAGKAGGTKIGGFNLVVLAARTLQHLVDKGVMTKEEAQKVLNRAKE